MMEVHIVDCYICRRKAFVWGLSLYEPGVHVPFKLGGGIMFCWVGTLLYWPRATQCIQSQPAGRIGSLCVGSLPGPAGVGSVILRLQMK